MSKGTLCWKCNNTCGGCSWSRSFKPVKGWTAKKEKFKDCGELVESYLVIKCPKFKPLKIVTRGIKENKINWFLKFSPYESAFTKEERSLVGLYLNNNSYDVAKKLHIGQRTVFRELNKIKQKLERLEERDSRYNKEVTIPACAEHNGLYSINVKLYWTCPVCGKTRGEVETVRSYDGSQVLFCDGWKNPCGHIDYYSAVRKEAKENGLNEVKSEIL